jgi:hypothetical protein
MAKPVRHYGKWRIRWVDENGRRQSAIYDEYKDAAYKLREHEHHVEEVKRGLRSPSPPKKTYDDAADYPRWTGEIRPTADGSKPANGRDPRPVRFYPAASSFCNAWRVRQLRGPHLRTWAWCRTRSSAAVTAATSPSSFPQSSTGRFDVMSVEARS